MASLRFQSLFSYGKKGAENLINMEGGKKEHKLFFEFLSKMRAAC